MLYPKIKSRIVDEELLEEIRMTPCLICHRVPSKEHPNDPHHITTRKAGGDDTRQNLMPLCRKHHTEIHKSIGKMAWRYPIIKSWLMKHKRYDVIQKMDRV